MGPGTLVAVVGPSGAGKDSLIAFAAQRLDGDPRFMIARRVITRQADMGVEDHDTVTAEQFRQMEKCGELAVTWQAHGLRYGLRAAALAFVMEGGIVIANCSRSALDCLDRRFPKMHVVLVTADREVRALRLAARNRETPDAIAVRLARELSDFRGAGTASVIENNDLLENATAQFMSVLAKISTEDRTV